MVRPMLFAFPLSTAPSSEPSDVLGFQEKPKRFAIPVPEDRSSLSAKWRNRLRRVWYGKDLQRPTYYISNAIFLRLLGVVYLIAFVSLWTQVTGLVGDQGILPIGNYLESARQYFAAQDPPRSAIWNLPTLLWLDPHDGMLRFLCAAGTVLALMLITGLLPMLSLIGMWVAYLSLFYGGQVFLGFQWDILLLETGFIAIFLAPWAWRSKFLGDPHPPRWALFLIGWLLFRLMLESGAVKLSWNDWAVGADGHRLANSWESLTALNYHYWTQPLPLWTSWYAAKLPEWFQKLSILMVFAIELVLPWFIFGPRVFRSIAFGGFTLLMFVIGATGNYNFFDLLTFALALTLLDDHAWPKSIRGRIHASAGPHWYWRNVWLVPFALFVLVVGLGQIKQAISPAESPKPTLASRLHLAQFHWVNDYGLFRRMTETRPEIVIEGSNDERDWKPYEFFWKPGDPSRRPRWNSPHQPRLDWQMWFEALRLESVYEQTGRIDSRFLSPWFQSFLLQLLRGEPEVTGLLDAPSFAHSPPRFIRILLYQYRFTSFAKRRATGDWWNRKRIWTGPAWSLRPLAEEDRR